MASSDGPRQGLDRGVAALRWMLVSAQEDATARAQVLPAVAKCTVLVATWANAPDTVRVISETGGVSMPLFTGHDALEHAAKRFGWSAGTQSVSFRAIGGREALQHAVIQEVQRVVVDAGAEHAFEVTSKEVAAYLLRSTGTDLESTLRVSATPPPPQEPRTGRIEKPIERSTGLSKPISSPSPRAKGIEPHLHKKPKLAEIDDPFASSAGRHAPVKREKSPGGVVRKVASTSQPPLSRQMPSQPFESARPASKPREDDALGRQQTQPLNPAEMRVASPIATTEPITPPASAAREAPKAKPEERERKQTAQGFPAVDLPDPAAQAAKAAAEARAQAMQARVQAMLDAPAEPVVRSADTYEFGGPASDPPDVMRVPPVAAALPAPAPAAAAAPARALRERPMSQPIMPGVERLGEMPVPQAKPARRRSEEMMACVDAPSTPPPRPMSMGKVPAIDPLAKTTAAELPSPAPPPKQPVVPEAQEQPVAAPAPPAAAAAPERAPHVNLEALEEPLESLDDSVLAAMADELRKYPEIEWACELSDGSELTVIGVRIEPSYTARAMEIETKVGRAGRAKGGRLQIVPLVDGTVTKNARAKGRMFYPWKKKK